MDEKVPRVTAEEAPAIARALKKRMGEVKCSQRRLAKKARISVETIATILGAETKYRPYKRSNLSILEQALETIENSPVVDDPAFLRQKESKEKCVAWGAKLRDRRKELGLSRDTLAGRVKSTKQRLAAIEEGRFKRGNPTVAEMLKALGCNEDLEKLDSYAPFMPDWVVERNQQMEQEALAEIADIQQIGSHLKTLRLARGMTMEEMDAKSGSQDATNRIENEYSYSNHRLKKILTTLRLGKSGDHIENLKENLNKYMVDNGIEAPDMAQMQARLELLYIASRILRTYWNIKAEDMEKYCEPKYKLDANTMIALENPNHAYGVEGGYNVALEVVIGLMAVLYNADQGQARPFQMLNACPSLKCIASIAKEGKPFTYGRNVKLLLERAMNDIIYAALDAEEILKMKKENETTGLGTKKAMQQVGLRHWRNTETRSLSDMIFRSSGPAM